jgi:double-stranded uracil-DNA glycosylase
MPKKPDKTGLSRGFPPVVGSEPRVLLLGSLPGRASLEAGQYYAQPRNAFWTIVGELCGARSDLDYADRLEALTRSGIALWDVLHAAVRPGSLDSNIIAASQRVNDIAALIAAHETISLVAFNGQKAAEIFRRRIESSLARTDIAFATLPSTSPAHATLTRDEKLVTWREVLMPHLRAV